MPNKTQTEVKQRQYSNLSDEIEDGIRHESVITIMAPAEEIYSFWRDLRNLPRFMKHLSSIDVTGPETSHWKWSVLKGSVEIEWDSEIVRDVPGTLIAWRSKEGSTVAHTGEVSFRELPFNRGTEVRVILNYHPPGGSVTDFIEKILGESPHRELQDDLHRLRSLMEAGEIITVEGQSRGGMEETFNPKFYSHH
jgi:uncharacterized membrane protein